MFCKDIKKWLITHQPGEASGNALRRLTTLSLMISALIRGGRASLQCMGDSMELDTDLESRVKKAKRWLNSKWTDVEAHFIPYVLPIIVSLSKSGQLVLAIDGSAIGKSCTALMVSIIWRGRAIPISWLVRQAPKGHFPQEMHVAIINQVAMLFDTVIQTECRIILLGDGEFDGTDLQQTCLDHQWDYVLKTAKDTLIADNPQMENPSRLANVCPEDGYEQIVFQDMYINKQGYGIVNVVYWHSKKYENPLYLLTNLEYAPLAESFYRKRYCIETFFGDIKSRGFNIHRTKISAPQTIFNLLIVASLAFIIVILFEFDARKSELLAKFCRKSRIDHLSVFQIGFRGLLYYLKKSLCISFQFSKNFP